MLTSMNTANIYKRYQMKKDVSGSSTMYHLGITRVSEGYHPRGTYRIGRVRGEATEREENIRRSGGMGLRVSGDGDNNSSKQEAGSVAAAAAPSKSLDGLAREATMASVEAADGDTEFSREERARKALECDCVAELRDGPCGSQFSEAFFCFLTSTADEQGSDCIKPFIAMQTCMAANPEAFVKYGDEANSNSSNSAIDGECKPQPGDRQDAPSVPSPPAGAVKNPIP